MTTIVSVSTPRKRHRLSKMSFDFVSLVPAGDDPAAQVVISKAAPDNNDGGNMPEDLISKADLPDDVVDYIEGLEDQVDVLTKSVTDAETERDEAQKALADAQAAGVIVKSEEEQFEALLEKADPAVRVLLQKQRDDLEAVSKRAEEEREARLEAAYISKAAALPMIAESQPNLAGLLRRVADALTPEDAQAVEKILADANTQIAKGGLFAEFGRQGGETTVSKSVDAKAEEIRKAHPEMTIDQARAQAYEDDPALLEQAMTEGR